MDDVRKHGDIAGEIRADALGHAPESKRVSLGQHLTPLGTARLASSLFGEDARALRCLDLGAGSGMLSACLAERFDIDSLDVVEMDASILPYCKKTLSFLGGRLRVFEEDVFVCADSLGLYDRIVLNPPYRKMRADDRSRLALPVAVPNYYAAFMCIAVEHLADGGEMVAIVPRSWMNGAYFKEFRCWLFDRCSIDAVHVYNSRSEVFSDTDVLQEVVLVKCSKRAQAAMIAVSSSEGCNDAVSTKASFAFSDLIEPDGDRVMRIAPDKLSGYQTMLDLGLCVSTGKVVDFRVRDHLLHSFCDRKAVPLIYPCNLHEGEVRHPIGNKKPQWLAIEGDEPCKYVIPCGWYVLVRRFSAKEERRRVVASVFEAQSPVAVENHLNIVHAGTRTKIVPLTRDLARGLALWLNSTASDESFRLVGGSTQVNARDLLSLPVPSRRTLLHLGAIWADVVVDDQDAVDDAVREVFGVAC